MSFVLRIDVIAACVNAMVRSLWCYRCWLFPVVCLISQQVVGLNGQCRCDYVGGCVCDCVLLLLSLL